jgi:glycosyltransferase involved in cell wall biosynthesis
MTSGLVTSRQKEFSRPVRIGVDGRRLGSNLKGIGRYVWELCKGLDRILPAAAFFLYAPRPLNLPLISHRWSLRIDNSPLGRRLPNNLWLVARAGRHSRRDGLDSFWAGTGLLPLIGLKGRAVLTVHDLIYRVAPQTMDRRARWAVRLFFPSSLSRADAIVSNSLGTADRLRANFGFSVAAVVRPGVSEVFQPQPETQTRAVLAHYGLSRPYLLSVATWEPRKGLEPLIRVFLRMKSEGMLRSHRLVLVGERGWKDKPIARLADSAESVVSLGFVDDLSLAALYSSAEVFIYPSTYEGFGMPVLEALACGARVVTSDLPELREAGGEAAIYVSGTEEGIHSGILRALANAPAQQIDWRRWNWTKSASVLAQVLLDCAPMESQVTQPRSHETGATIWPIQTGPTGST